MNSMWLFVLGLAMGCFVGWLLGAARARDLQIEEFAELRGKLAASERMQIELREQLSARDKNLEQIHTQLTAAQVERAAALSRLDSMKANLEEQKQLLADASARFTDAFRALSAEALSKSSDSFLQLAVERFRTLQQEAKGELAQREQAIQALVSPLGEALERYQGEVRDMERERQTAYGSIENYLKTLGETSQRLQHETASLVTAFTKPGVKGRWGELTLRRVVEAAGMSQYCDFVEQPTAESPEGRRRPDLIVKLPGGRTIVVDAKVPLKAYMDAMEAPDAARGRELMLLHVNAVRASMRELGSKNYWSQFDTAPNFVVLFLPAESFFSAALELDRELIVDGIANQVVLATPTTLIACMLIVAYGWQQQKMADNAQRIADVGAELYDRLLKFVEHLQKIRDASEQVCHAVNEAIGSFDTRLVPGARKLRELGAGESMDEIQAPQTIETPLRSPQTES